MHGRGAPLNVACAKCTQMCTVGEGIQGLEGSYHKYNLRTGIPCNICDYLDNTVYIYYACIYLKIETAKFNMVAP